MLRALAIWSALSVVCAGCRWFPEETNTHNPLAKPRMSRDSVVLEVFFARLPADETETLDGIWKDIDEQVLPAMLRRRLAENGFRAGVIGGQLPAEVQSLLDQQADGKQPPAGEDPQGMNVVDVDKPANVRIRSMAVRAGRRGEIMASSVYDRVPILERLDGQLRGKYYDQCQCMLAVTPTPHGDGSVQLEVLPEVHFGQPQRSFSGEDGVWRLKTGRPRKDFAQLAMNVRLAPGEMLVIGALPDRPGSIGHYFLTEDSAGRQQRKILFIRSAQTQFNDFFAEEPGAKEPAAP